jgi:4-hydroxy-3-polyprenylbenzoate decarboxylase
VVSPRLVVGVTGASGALYAVRFLKACLEGGVTVELVVSDYGQRLLIEECGLNLKVDDLPAWIAGRWPEEARPVTGTLRRHAVSDLGAPIASGSQRWDGMVVVPCSMKTLSGIARGAAGNLIERAADVTLKERRPLVLVPRETPLHLIHLDNLRAAALAGAVLVPAMPAFYQKPQRLEDLADFVAGRILQVLGLPQQLVPAWEG